MRERIRVSKKYHFRMSIWLVDWFVWWFSSSCALSRWPNFCCRIDTWSSCATSSLCTLIVSCRLTYIVCATILMIGGFVIYCCIRRKRPSLGIASCMEPGVFKMANDEIMRLTAVRNALEASKFTQWPRFVTYNSSEHFSLLCVPH